MLAGVTPEEASPASQPVHDVEVRWDVRIPVRDGLELSANLWLPRPAADDPDARFASILEMIPYGKDNWHRNSDVAHGEYLAARGVDYAQGWLFSRPLPAADFIAFLHRSREAHGAGPEVIGLRER